MTERLKEKDLREGDRFTVLIEKLNFLERFVYMKLNFFNKRMFINVFTFGLFYFCTPFSLCTDALST